MTTFLIGWTALGAIAFCFIYALLAPFYKSEGGWNLMSFMVVVGTMVTMALYFRSTGTRAPEWLANTMWALAGLCVWWRVTIVLRAQLQRRRRPR